MFECRDRWTIDNRFQAENIAIDRVEERKQEQFSSLYKYSTQELSAF